MYTPLVFMSTISHVVFNPLYEQLRREHEQVQFMRDSVANHCHCHWCREELHDIEADYRKTWLSMFGN